MDASRTKEFEEWSPGRPNKFRVAIVYETALDGMRAKRFSDELAAEMANGKAFDLNMNVWNFAVLQAADICCLAACAAAAADVVIISVAGGGTLPPQVGEWLRLWAALAKKGSQLVAVLFAGPVQENAPIRAALRKSVMRAGIDCFTHTPRGAAGVRCCEKLAPGGVTCLLGGTRSIAGKSRSAVVPRTPARWRDPARREIY